MTFNVSVNKVDAYSDYDGAGYRDLHFDLNFNAAVQLLRF